MFGLFLYYHIKPFHINVSVNLVGNIHAWLSALVLCDLLYSCE